MKQHNRRGFTMAELLIVVAIIGVLAGVAFVAVAQHQRSLERVERDSVAREIFVAAQNHLTMAQGQGYLGLSGDTALGNAYTDDDGNACRYFAVYQGTQFSGGAPTTLLDLMLPIGAIDETVRSGGSYIICYHPQSATVKDVFYCSTDPRFGYDLTGANLTDLLTNWREGKESARRNFNGKVLGWYGGESVETLARNELQAPDIVIENGAKLRVGIMDNNKSPDSGSLQLILKGLSSGAEKVFDLKSTDDGFSLDSKDYSVRLDSNKQINGVEYDYVIVLDDITAANLHFADLVADTTKQFIPGEDISVQAKAFDNTAISNIAYSAELTTNSLYEKLEYATTDTASTMTASVSNIRHLENLDNAISNVTTSRTIGEGAGAVTYTLTSAVQTSDMRWNDFLIDVGNAAASIYPHGEDATPTDSGCYMPISPDYITAYDGQCHSISDIKVNTASDAGLFGQLGSAEQAVSVKDLALVNFDIKALAPDTGAANAGTLAGSLTNATVTNVSAYHDQNRNCGVVANSGSAGGLIGDVSGCTVSKSSASVTVSSSAGSAGGLIGTANAGSVSGCFSGGHTDDDPNGTGAAVYSKTAYNVSASVTAGGLIGEALSTDIQYSYSTCSATGETAGGFVGTTTGPVSHCYATGLVQGTGDDSSSKTGKKEGAFAYSLTGAPSDCHYYEIINEREDADKGYVCLDPLGSGANANITALDASADTYNQFIGGDDDWKPASPYDDTLLKYYDGKYPLPTVEQLGATLAAGDDDRTDYFVATHRGDWPAPEVFITNTPAD